MTEGRLRLTTIEFASFVCVFYFTLLKCLLPEELPFAILEFLRIGANVRGFTEPLGGHEQGGQKLCNGSENVVYYSQEKCICPGYFCVKGKD